MKKYLVKSLALLMAVLLAVPPTGALAEEPETEPVSTEVSVDETAGETPASAEPAPEGPVDSVTDPEIGLETEPEPEAEPEAETEPEVEPEVEPEGEEASVSLMGEDVELLATTASGTCGTNLKWTLDDAGTLTISGSGAMTEYASQTAVPWHAYRASITKVVLKSGVTSIGGYAFVNCTAMESVTIPSGIKSIGTNAFASCKTLESVTLPEGVTTLESAAFYYCSAITSISLPSTLTTMGEKAFYNCSALTGIEIPENVTAIKSNTFYACKALRSISIPKKVTAISLNAFSSCSALEEVWYGGAETDWSSVTVGSGNDYLKNAVFHFAGTSNLASGTCGTNLQWTMHHDGTLAISGTGAMTDYESTSASGGSAAAPWCVYNKIIRSVTFPSGLTTIGADAFSWCNQLEVIEVPKGVTTIGKDAFWSCKGLTEIYVPRSVTMIGTGAFAYCSAVTDLYYGGTEEDWAAVSKPSSYLSFNPEIHYTDNLCGEDAFWTFDAATGTLTITGTGDMEGYLLTTRPWESYVNQIKKVVIENGITSVGNSAFEDCVNLTSVSLPTSLTKIDNFAFNGCAALESIAIPFGVQTLGTMAFWTCRALNSISLPSTLTTIGQEVFGYCDSLAAITIPASVTAIGAYAFAWAGLQSITVPAGVTSMGERVFFRCPKLANVTFAEGSPLTTIPESTFYDCGILAEITLPQSVKKIGDDAFYNCTALKDVYFRGSLDQWNAVSIGGSNYYLTAATIHVAKIAEGTCGDALTWLLTGEGELIISGTGAMYDFTNNARQGWYDYRESILRVTVESGVTSIGNQAFMSCSEVTAVILPGSVKTIGDDAFSYASKLGAVTIPNGVTSIGESVFSGCSNLTTVTFAGNSVTSIGGRAFSGTKLAAITLPASLKSIGEFVFEMCPLSELHIPTGTTEIAESAFGWSNITSFSVAEGNPSFGADDGVLFDKDQTTLVAYPTGRSDAEYVVPEGTTAIGSAAFWFSGLKFVILPDSLETIGYGAFQWSDEILYLKIPAGVTEIGDYAFEGIYELKGVEFTGEAPTIGANAFNDLEISVYYPAGDATWTEEVRQNYGGTLTWKTEKTIVSSGTCGTEDSSLTWTLDETGLLAISGTGDMKDYTYNSYTEVPWYGKDVYHVVIGEGVTSIGDYTFYGGDMINVTIPGSVTEIGQCAFAYSYLKTVNFAGNAPTIDSTAFRSVTATACYPREDTTWTADKRANYGGTLTWKAVKEKVTSGKCGDDLTWNYDAKTGALTISGTGTMYDFNTYSGSVLPAPPWYDYCASIKMVMVEEGVTAIGQYAFDDCTALTTATLANSVTIIGNRAFDDCTALTSVSMLDALTTIGDNAFDDCIALTSVSLPDTLTSIGHEAFQNCEALTGVDLPNGLTFLGVYAFFDCDALTSIVIPEGVTAILDATFQSCDALTSVTLPSGITDIWDWAFDDCKALTEITIPSSVTTIKGNAFSGCSSLKKISFTGDAPSIGTNAFTGVTATALYPLGNATWTNSVRQNYGGDLDWMAAPGLAIGGRCGDDVIWKYDAETRTLTISGTGDMYDYSYYADVPYARTDIDTVVVGEGVTSLGDHAFTYFGMKKVKLPESLKEIGYRAFAYCSDLTESDIPAGVTRIGSEAFSNCGKLTGIELPDGVTSIGEATFWRCASLEEIVIPEKVTSIGTGAFQECTGLKEVTIPQSVTGIGNDAFGSCTALTDVYYGSSKTAWDAIGKGVNNGALTSATIHYTNPSGTCGDDLTWTLDGNGTLTISGTGAMYDFSDGGSPWYSVRGQITDVSLPDGLTAIGQYAFEDCAQLGTVSFGSGLKIIGEHAFDSCRKLESLRLPTGLEEVGVAAFLDCSGVKEVVFSGAALKKLNTYAFIGCTSLTSITLPAGISQIGPYVFKACSNLKEIVFEGDAPSIDYRAFTDITATVWYPYGNATWTEAKRDNYGGTLTWCVSAPETFPGAGGGTKADPYQVDSAETLECVRYFEDAYFLQTEDIDLTGVDWAPIPAFTGTYDGGGYKITGLTAALTSAEENQVLGGLMDTATGEIKNVHLENISVTLTNTTVPTNSNGEVYVGGIVGMGGIISNSSVSGTVQLTTCIWGHNYIAGIAGMADTVTDCINRAAVTVNGSEIPSQYSRGNGQYVGGVAGLAETVARCANLGSVTVGSANDFSRKYWLGGVVGNAGTVTESYNRGTVILTHDYSGYAGGVCGSSDTVENCYNAGSVTCTVTDRFKAIGGLTGGGTSVMYSYNAGTVSVTGGGEDTVVSPLNGNPSGDWAAAYYLNTSCESYTSAEALAAEEMQDPASFSGFDFDEVWCYGTEETYRYPVLRAFGDVSHVFLTYTYNNDATCTEDGTETALCAVCGDATDTRPAPGSSSGHTEVADEAKAPTCGATGLTAGSHCSVCGEIVVAQETVPATGEHNWVPATLQAPKTCTVCGATEGVPLNGNFTAGSGTAADPYQIETKLQLDNMRNYLSSHFVLVNDIEFVEEDFAPGGVFCNDGKGWIPIGWNGTSAQSFTGSLDGQDHTISGLQSHHSGTACMVGLFSCLGSNTVVKDLTLGGFDVSLSAASQDGYVGALAGYCSSYGAISSVTVTDSQIQGTTDSRNPISVGGIVGYAGSGSYNGSIGNCTVTDSVTVSGTSASNPLYVGGIVGKSHQQPIRDCSSAATVQAESSSYVVGVGGIAGSVTGTSQTDRCTYSGTLTCTAKGSAIGRAGGIVGDSRDQVYGCVNTGSVSLNSSSSNAQKAGGIVGNAEENCGIMECVNKGAVTSNAMDGYTAGIVGFHSTNGSGISACRNEGDISAAFNAGGIAGLNYKSDIGDCRNTGRVYSSNGNAAGIVVFFADVSGQLHGCANFGEIVADSGNAAGIVEKLYRPLYNCYNAGNVKQTDGSYAAAGIAVNLHSTLNLCYNAGMVMSGSNLGAAITPSSATQNGWYFLDNLPSAFSGFVNTVGQRTHEQMQQAATFAGFDFSNVWDFEPLSGYRYPQLRYEMPKLTGVELLEVPEIPIRWFPGEALDLTGLQGIAAFDDGSTNVFDLTVDLFPDLDPTTAGLQTVHISYKGFTSERTLTVEVHAHDYSETVTAPTCTEQGCTTYSCSCGYSYMDDFVAALGHSYGKDGLCIRCGTEEPVPSGTCGSVTWVLRDEVLILTPTDGEEGTMASCASAAKYPWSQYADDITEIEVGEGVLNISTFAFAEMRHLESVFLGESVEQIGEGAFAESGRGLEITICNPDCEIFDDEETLSEDVWVLAHTGSTAEEFADEYGYDFCGTANRDSTPGHKTVQILMDATCVEGEHALTYCDNQCGYQRKGKYRTDPSGIHTFDDDKICAVCGLHGTQTEDGTVTPILSGQCGDALYWALSDDRTTLTLTGSGTMWSYEEATYLAAEEDDVEEREGSTAPWNYYASEIKALVLPEGMTTVGSCAFVGFRSAAVLALPESLKSIGERAFSGFGTLKEPIEDLTIPANVQHINADAFADAAFSGTLSILGPVEELAKGAFDGCCFDEVLLGEGVEALRERALSFCSEEGDDLTALTIHLPLSLQRIERWAIDGYESDDALTLNYAGCEERWNLLVESGNIDSRMTVRDVNVVTADHSFTNYVPDNNGSTETAACDFGCGKADTRDIPAAPDPIDDVQAIYVEDNRLVLLQNVPSGATVILAAYEEGQMAYIDWKADASATTSFVLPGEVQDAELRIFFLNGSHAPLGKFIPMSI